MKKHHTPTLVTTAGLALALGMSSALAAEITNQDAESHTLPVTEAGVRTEVVIDAGATVSICAAGCFITMPNGDRAALVGTEVVDIVNGAAVIR